VSLAEVALAAAALLDAADERMTGVDLENVSYDHAGAEAGLVAAGCLELAGNAGDAEDIDAALSTLRVALGALGSLPIPTGQSVLLLAIRAELRRQGKPAPAHLELVA
jgi:hypothetical protein